MNWLKRFFLSSIGAKIVMAITGFGLVLYLVQHLIANLQIFAAPEKLNTYAHSLHELWWLVWGGRVLLIVGFILHVLSAWRLTVLNRRARGHAYAEKKPVRASFASRTMMVSGVIVLAFLVFHVAQFTLGWVNPEEFAMKDPLGYRDLHSIIVLGLQRYWVGGFYCLALVLVGLHMSHGVSSMWQSVGWNSPKYNRLINSLGPIVGVILAVGFLLIPVAVLAGLISL